MSTNKNVSGASAVVELTPEIVMAVLTRDLKSIGDDFLTPLSDFVSAEMAKPETVEKPAKAKRAGRRAA